MELGSDSAWNSSQSVFPSQGNWSHLAPSWMYKFWALIWELLDQTGSETLGVGPASYTSENSLQWLWCSPEFETYSPKELCTLYGYMYGKTLGRTLPSKFWIHSAALFMGGLGIPSSQKIIVLQIWLVNSKPMLELYFLVPSCIVFERSNMNLGKRKMETLRIG